MIEMIFDTETTGMIPDFKADHTQPDMPRVVQFAARFVCNTEAECMLIEDLLLKLPEIVPNGDRLNVGSALRTVHFYINPHMPIGTEASRVTGITDDMVGAYGIDWEDYLWVMDMFIEVSDTVICHNKSFDIRIVAAALYADTNVDHSAPLLKLLTMPQGCTMKSLTGVLKISNPRNPRWFKWPTLTEAYCRLIDEKGFIGAHDAMNDVNGTYELYKWCRKNGINVYNN